MLPFLFQRRKPYQLIKQLDGVIKQNSIKVSVTEQSCNNKKWMVGSHKLKEILDAGLPNTSPMSDTSEPPQPGMGSPPPPEDDWLISIEKNLERARRYDAAGSGSKINIYRVPHRLKDPLREKAYIPQVVSLGPYHHGNKLLQPMELHKWRALNNVLKRNNQNIKLYLDSMKELEDRARACYEEQLKLNTNEFAEMMVLDGCFVLELFQGFTKPNGFVELGYAWNDLVFSMRGKIDSIRKEMIMLENQIPLIVLGKLLELVEGSRDQAENEVVRRAIYFLKPLMETDEQSSRDSTTYDPQSDEVGLHCLDVFRKYLLSKGPDNVQSSTRDSTTSDPQSDKVGLHCLDVLKKYILYKGPDHFRRKWSRDNHEADNRRQQLIHCVTDLKDAGIKFRGHKTDRLWDIQFNNGVLDIPPIQIDDDTKPMLCNLIAFEQCHLDCTLDITNYVAFLDDLINSAEDVSHLRRHKIIENWLGSDREVAELVNGLCQEVVSDFGASHPKLCKEINEHYDRKWNTWRAALKQKYFSSPWAILSLVAAVTLLLLTAAQTFYTVYPYYVPRN